MAVDETGDGVLVSHGDQGGGYSPHVENGRLVLAYTEYGTLHETDAGLLGPGPHEILLSATAEGAALEIHRHRGRRAPARPDGRMPV